MEGGPRKYQAVRWEQLVRFVGAYVVVAAVLLIQTRYVALFFLLLFLLVRADVVDVVLLFVEADVVEAAVAFGGGVVIDAVLVRAALLPMSHQLSGRERQPPPPPHSTSEPGLQ